MDRSPGFGSTVYNYVALLRLGFPSAPKFSFLTSLHTVTRWLVLQKARCHPYIGLQLLVGTRFQVLFHSPPGVLFTFPSRYFSSIGHQVVFSLGRWASLIPTRFLVSSGTLDSNLHSTAFVYRAFTSFGLPFQVIQLAILCFYVGPNPSKVSLAGLGSFPFARRYLGNRLLFRRTNFLSFPPGT